MVDLENITVLETEADVKQVRVSVSPGGEAALL
jgi:hypothetical protein